MKSWIVFLVQYAVVAAAGTAAIALGTSYFHDKEQAGLIETIQDAVPSSLRPSKEPVLQNRAPAGDNALPAPDTIVRDTPVAHIHEEPAAPAPPRSPLPTQRADDRRWAVVMTPRARSYTTKGKYRGRLEAGTLLDVTRTVKNGAEPLLLARVVPSPPGADPIVVRLEDLDIRPGACADASDDEKALRIQRAELLATLQQLKRPSSSSLRRENPYVDEYSKSRKAYREYWTKVNALKEKWDNSAGEEHMQYGEELRKLKGLDIRLGMQLEQAKEKYDQWNQEHPAKTTQDGKIAAINAELTEVRKALKSFEGPRSGGE